MVVGMECKGGCQSIDTERLEMMAYAVFLGPGCIWEEGPGVEEIET